MVEIEELSKQLRPQEVLQGKLIGAIILLLGLVHHHQLLQAGIEDQAGQAQFPDLLQVQAVVQVHPQLGLVQEVQVGVREVVLVLVQVQVQVAKAEQGLVKYKVSSLFF